MDLSHAPDMQILFYTIHEQLTYVGSGRKKQGQRGRRE